MDALKIIRRDWKPGVEAKFGRGHSAEPRIQEVMQTSTRLTTWRPAATGRIAS